MTSLNTYNQTAPTSSPQDSQPGFLQKAGNFVGGLASDAYNTLLATPAVRAGQAIGDVALTGINKLTGGALNKYSATGNLSTSLGNAESKPVTTPGGVTVQPQKAFGQGGAEQIGGNALKTASYLAPGVGAEGVASNGIVSGALQGATTGAISGGLGGAGQSMTQSGNASDVLNAGIRGAGIGAATGGAVGGITGAVGNIWDKIYGEGATSGYQTNVDQATAINNQAGINAMSSIHEASNTLNDVKTGLGNQFAEAPNIISQVDPNAKVSLPADFVHELNALKDTKTFVLPESIRTGGGLNGEMKLTPQQTQDLMTQLNALTYKAKASGDLAINQQTIGLSNRLKGFAQENLGHVTDAQGNSVWQRAYQDYTKGSDAVDAMSNLIPNKRTPNEILDPTKVNDSMNKMMKLTETPQGRATLVQANAQFKNATGYDLLNDPMGSISKLIDSNTELESAIKGGYMKQLQNAVTNPNAVGRRLLYATTALLSITAISAAFRKQIGNFLTGQ